MNNPQISSETIAEWQQNAENMSAAEIVRWAAEQFPGRIGFATSLGLEDQALLDIIASESLDIEVFTLDTGRLFPETYDLIEKTEKHYDLRIRAMFPDAQQVSEMVAADGINLFRQSIELRKKCCGVRKIAPLQTALKSYDAWIVGLRAEQSVTRLEMKSIEWDAGNGLVKVSPLTHWSEQQVRDYIAEKNVPYNPLHDAGFPSIGCASCTRAIEPGEDVRAGRWWWEMPEQKECGLHGRFTAGEKEK